MKKIVLSVLIAVLSLLMISSVSASQTIQVNVGFDKVNFTQELGFPYIDDNNRTEVPVRAVATALNGKIDWDSVNQVATITYRDGTEIKFKIGSKVYTVNNKKMTMDTVPVIKDGRLYVPVRFLVQENCLLATETTKGVFIIHIEPKYTIDKTYQGEEGVGVHTDKETSLDNNYINNYGDQVTVSDKNNITGKDFTLENKGKYFLLTVKNYNSSVSTQVKDALLTVVEYGEAISLKIDKYYSQKDLTDGVWYNITDSAHFKFNKTANGLEVMITDQLVATPAGYEFR